MPNTDYRRRSPSPHSSRKTYENRGGKRSRSRSRSRSRRREEARDRHEHRTAAGLDTRHETSHRSGESSHRRDDSSHRRDELPYRRDESSRRRDDPPPVRYTQEAQRRREYTRRDSPPINSPQRARRSPSPLQASPVYKKSHDHQLDTHDHWADAKVPVWAEQNKDAAPDVMKSLHSIYDYAPPTGKTRLPTTQYARSRSRSRSRDLRSAIDRSSRNDNTLDARFPGPRKEPHIDENITVDIERKIHGVPVFTIDRGFKPELVVVPRRRAEGHQPMFDRDEVRAAIANQEAQVPERRVVKIAGGGGGSRSTSGDRHGHRSADRDRRTGVLGYDQGHEGRDDKGDLRLSLNSKRWSGDGGGTERSHNRSARDVRDRLGSRSGRDAERPIDARSRLGARSEHNVSDRSRERREAPGVDAAEEALPDFSRRPDKFMYAEWMDKPELIPRGSAYFEHDDRDGIEMNDPPRGRGRGYVRGRGRGVFRGRGAPRGRGVVRGVGRGNFSSYKPRRDDDIRREPTTVKYSRHSPGSNKWKHDKFRDALEDDVTNEHSNNGTTK